MSPRPGKKYLLNGLLASSINLSMPINRNELMLAIMVMNDAFFDYLNFIFINLLIFINILVFINLLLYIYFTLFIIILLH